MHASRYAQRGQYLISALLALAVVAAALVEWAHTERANYTQAADNAQGAALAQYGIGLRGYLANVQSGTTTMPSNPYVVAGVTWLKPPTCGGLGSNPTQGYVPCSFTGGAHGSVLSTTITQTPATKAIEARAWFTAPPLPGGGVESAAANASKIVLATLAQQSLPINGMFLTAFANSSLAATQPATPTAIAAADRGRVMLIANNAPSNDIWLRVDGTNQMLADLNMGGNSIANAKNADFAGDVRVHGTEQIDNGLSVTAGTVDARGGVIEPDAQITGIDQYASQGIYNAEVLTGQNQYTVSQPDCSRADGGSGSTPAIYAALQQTGSLQGQADGFYSAGVSVINNGTTWTVTPAIEGTLFWLTAAPAGGGGTNITLNKKLVAVSPSQQTVLVETKCR